jgi:hypothetical protein
MNQDEYILKICSYDLLIHLSLSCRVSLWVHLNISTFVIKRWSFISLLVVLANSFILNIRMYGKLVNI